MPLNSSADIKANTDKKKEKGGNYIVFECADRFSINTKGLCKIWKGKLFYSFNARAWKEWGGEKISGKKIYFRGLNNTQIAGYNVYNNYMWVITSQNNSGVKCTGNIENLLDYKLVEKGIHPAMAGYCFTDMFNGCKNLIKGPDLPATNLSQYCYMRMFSRTGLIESPVLPAETLITYCYGDMFNDCKSLKKAGNILAENVSNSSQVYHMFNSCSSLKIRQRLFYGLFSLFSSKAYKR